MDLKGDPIGKYEAIGTDLGSHVSARAGSQTLRSANARKRKFGAEN